MSFLYFEDDELDILYQAINNQQICFHPIYAPEGKFTVKASFDLQSDDKDTTVIAGVCIVFGRFDVVARQFFWLYFRANFSDEISMKVRSTHIKGI